VKILITGIVLGLVFTTSVQAWSVNSQPGYQLSEVKSFNSNPCSGIYQTIAVSGEGSIEACVMGKKVRVASFYPAQGGVAYAISFPLESSFYRLDVCGGVWGCIYADDNDTFVGLFGEYKHLVKGLVKNTYQGVIHYTPSEQSAIFNFTSIAHLFSAAQSVAMSGNGKWGLVEVRDFGIFRINTQTLEARRIIAPGFSYGLGSDPRVEMAISNDGGTAAIIGLRMGIWVVSIDNSCGDSPNEFTQRNYIGAITPCRFIPTPSDAYIPSFSYALRPRFSEDGSNLSFEAFSANAPPRHVILFSKTGVTQENGPYAAIGDSFTSGEGEIDDSFYIGGAQNKCHVSSRSYPFLLASLWGFVGYSTACSGATMDAARGQSPNQPNQLQELESHVPHVTTIGIGGNDAGLMGKLKTCLGLDTCEWANTPTERYKTALEIKSLYPRLKQFYNEVKTRTPGSVVVVGYPRVIYGQSRCVSPIGLLLNETERTFMNEAIHYLNQVIQAAASSSEVEYVDIEEVFVGGELCTSLSPPFMNGIRSGDEYAAISMLPALKIIGAESFHPTPAGHAQVASRISQAFPNPNSQNLCSTCTGQTSAPSPSAYWEGEEVSSVPRQAVSFLNKVTIKKGDSFSISLPAFSFKPSSNATIELHSDVKSLATVQTAEDGSLETTLSTVDLESGFHSVHVIGKDFSGNTIDTYDFLAIEATAPSTIPIFTSQPGDISNTRQHLLTSTNRPGSSGEVLGASILAIPNNFGLGVKKPQTNLPLAQQKSTTDFHYQRLILLGIILALIILGISACIYYLKKASVYRDG
jgi:lysophospholipase L1-like esterase